MNLLRGKYEVPPILKHLNDDTYISSSLDRAKLDGDITYILTQKIPPSYSD